MRFPIRTLFLLLALTLVACEGAQGPQGLTGPAGPSGPAGPTGPPGNANVDVVTFDYDFTMPVTTSAGPGLVSIDEAVPEITEATYERGAVFAYVSDGSFWAALPWTQLRQLDGDAGVETLEYSPAFAAGSFNLLVYGIGFEAPYTESGQIRLVIVHGPSGNLRQEDPPPYDELMRVLEDAG